MSADAVALKPLKVHRNSWNRREFLTIIVERYFIVHEEAYGIHYGWDVRPRKGENVHRQAEELDRHLSRLGWRASLREGDPWSISLIPEPYDIPALPLRLQYAAWLLTFLFAWASGAAWVTHQNAEAQLLDAWVLERAFASFALPLTGALLLVSSIRKRVAARFAVDTDHLLPVAVPFIIQTSTPFWPFSLIGLLNQRSLEQLPWPNRLRLAQVSLVMPLTLLTLGLLYTLAGLLFTPTTAPALGEAPIRIQLNALVQMFSLTFLPLDVLALRSAWLHPLALAGQTLMLFGWVLLIPVPGFPGHRLLTALLGPERMLEQALQLSMLGLFMLAAMFTLIISDFMPWFIVFALGAWRTFNQEAGHNMPLLLDEVAPLNPPTQMRLAAVAVFALLISFPGMQTVAPVTDWDEDVALDWPVEIDWTAGEQNSLELTIDLVGVHGREVLISAWLSPPRDGWNITLTCDPESATNHSLPATCSAGHVDPLNDGGLLIDASLPSDVSELTPTDLVLLVSEGMQVRSHSVRLNPVTDLRPSGPYWEFDGDLRTYADRSLPLLCSNISISGDSMPGNLSVSHPLWTIETPSDSAFNPVSDSHMVCVRGADGGLVGLERDEHGALLPLTLTLDDGSAFTWPLRLDVPLALLPSPVNGWHAHGDRMWTPAWLHSGAELELGEGELVCARTGAAREPGIVDGAHVWEADKQAMLRVPDLASGANLTLLLPTDGVLAVCEDDPDAIPPVSQNFALTPGPALALSVGGEIEWGWGGIAILDKDVELFNLGEENITVQVRYSGDVRSDFAWGDVIIPTVHPGEFESVEIAVGAANDSAVLRLAWFDIDSGAAVLNLAAHCLTPEVVDACGPGLGEG